jgi:nucleoid DNA-binding protein
MTVRPLVKESKEEKQQRLKNERNKKVERAEHKLLRKEEEKQHHIFLMNVFREFGIDYATLGKGSYARLQELWEGRKAVDLPLTNTARDFLKQNFDVTYIKDDFNQARLHFDLSQHNQKESPNLPDRLIKHLAEESGEPRSVVKKVYESLVRLCKDGLSSPKRRLNLPKLGRLSLRYRPATEKHEGHNPKTGEKLIIAARPPHNVLRFSPAKSLKLWAQDVEAIPPPKKQPAKKQKKRKHHKKYKSVFDEQKEFHIA